MFIWPSNISVQLSSIWSKFPELSSPSQLQRNPISNHKQHTCQTAPPAGSVILLSITTFIVISNLDVYVWISPLRPTNRAPGMTQRQGRRRPKSPSIWRKEQGRGEGGRESQEGSRCRLTPLGESHDALSAEWVSREGDRNESCQPIELLCPHTSLKDLHSFALRIRRMLPCYVSADPVSCHHPIFLCIPLSPPPRASPPPPPPQLSEFVMELNLPLSKRRGWCSSPALPRLLSGRGRVTQANASHVLRLLRRQFRRDIVLLNNITWCYRS